jgi:hypothetical protein
MTRNAIGRHQRRVIHASAPALSVLHGVGRPTERQMQLDDASAARARAKRPFSPIATRKPVSRGVSYTSAAKQNGFKFNLLYDGPYERAISLSAVAETYSARRDRLKAVRPRRFRSVMTGRSRVSERAAVV